MTGKGKTKSKKVVETSLGKAPKDTEKSPDESHLRKPITTSVSTLKQIFSLFQTATPEVQQYITYECDILYECRICRTIFRSLANFILHKRSYCREKCQFGGGNNETQGGFVINDDIKTSDEESRCNTPLVEGEGGDVTKNAKKGLLPIVDKLIKKKKIEILAKNILNEDLSAKTENSDDDVVFVSEESSLLLEKIDSSKAAVFQTTVRDSEKLEDSKEGLMKSEIMEIHGILDNNQAVIGSNGKICSFGTNKLPNQNIPKKHLTCAVCNFTFSTEKTLTHHIKYKHNKTCIVYPCPDCKETFSNAWSVYRHLYKVHRRTTSQVRRMRYLVHSSRIRKDQEPEKKKRKLTPEDENEENQWMNNIEGDKDFQMCGGCGKRFERKAALHSHSQMCTKRIAICNSIKNVKVPAKNDKKEKVEQNCVVSVKGAAKRKQNVPVVVRTFSEKPEKVEVITKSVDGDVTITKHTDDEIMETEQIFLPVLPEIEIFTISDDSSDNETNEKNKQETSETSEISDEYREYVTDEDDYNFLSQMMTYIDKDNLKCIPCETSYLSLYMLLRHMSLHFSWYRFQCSKCSFTSFHKYDCTTHAYSRHSIPNNLIDSTVLPIPNWKVLCTSHNFKTLGETDDSHAVEIMPQLEVEEEKKEYGLQGETIVLEDDEMPDLCTENGSLSDTVIVSDDEKKSKKEEAGPSKAINSRPIRNRQKSVKTVQNDFIYDLAKVFKVDSKSKKVKKSFNK